MRIFEVIDTYYPKIDGPINVVDNYIKNLNNIKGVKAEVFAPFKKNTKQAPYVVHRVKCLPAVEEYYMACPSLDRKIKKYLLKNKVDLIHVHSPFTLGRYFLKLGKKYGIPTVFTFHTAFKEDFERILKLKWQQKFMMNYIMKTINLAGNVWSVSNGAGELLKSYGYTGKINIIRNGTHFKYPNNAEDLISLVNKKFGFSENDIVFLSVGRIVENKRLSIAIEALKILKEKGHKFTFLIVGSGPYKNKLEKLVQSLGLENEIKLLGRIEKDDDLKALYLRANLFLFPSTFDTASLVPIESASMKTPTLLTKNCPTAEIIADNHNGYLAENSSEKWAEKLEEILSNKPKLTQMQETCFNEVYRTWESVVEEVFENYQNIIKKHKEAQNTNISKTQEK